MKKAIINEHSGQKPMNLDKRKRSEAIAVLRHACGKGVSLDLRVLGENSATEYRSRFLSLDENSEDPVVTIEAPALKGTVLPLRPNQQVKIIFYHNDQIRSFITSIFRRCKFKLNPQTSVASLELFLPEEISSGGKRGFYRLIIADDTPSPELKIAVLAEDEAKRIRSRERGIITDIGGGGLGFRMHEGKSLLLGLGTRLLLQFRLHPEGDRMSIMARVCFSLRRPDVREVFFGAQFIDVDSDIEYKRSVDMILRFIAEEQRRSLSGRTRSSI